MAAFIGKDEDGNEIKFIEEDGMRYPIGVVDLMQAGSFRKQLEQVRNLESRDDDVMIVAFVKSGTHWLWEIVTMIQNETTEYAKHPKELSMLDFSAKDRVDSLPSPRVLNMHYPVRWMPQQMLEKRCPILHIMRNPKDVFVSYYHHCNTLPPYQNVESFTAFLPMMLGENGYYLDFPWYEYELEWEKFTRENPDYPILNLYYEDLKKDLPREIAKIASFLKKNLDNDLLHEIAKKVDIDGLRKDNFNKDFGHITEIQNAKVDEMPVMYRKGVVGDWKNWFTVAENERVDGWLDRNLVNTDLKFQYT